MSNFYFFIYICVYNVFKVIRYYVIKYYILKKLKRNKFEVVFDFDKIKIKY